MKKKAAKTQIIIKLITIAALFGFTTLFSSVYEEKNTLIGFSIILMIITLTYNDLGIKRNQALGLISGFFVISAIFSQLASINPILGFFINLIYISSFMLVFTEQPQDMIYVPFLLMYVFETGNKCDIFDYLLRLMGLFVGLILVIIYYYLIHTKKEERPRSIVTILKHIEPQTERFNLALKTALSLSLTTLVCNLCPQNEAGYAIFISLTVLQLLSTDIYTANIKNPILPFVSLTIGVIAFYIFVPQQYFILVFLLFCVLFTIYKRYRIQMIFITISVMGFAKIILDFDTPIPWRIVPLIASLAFPVIINRINFSKIAFHIKDKFFPPDYNISR